MRTIRLLVASTLSTSLLALGAIAVGQVAPLPASATTPQWQMTASFAPLANVRAVSCAPSASLSTATCVAVGDDGAGHYASIIVTDNGGSTWTDGTAPAGVTALSTVSCPSALVCYAGGGSGIIKSSDGGSSWTVQDAAFPAHSAPSVLGVGLRGQSHLTLAVIT